MTRKDDGIGAPIISSNLLRGANAGLILVILGLYAAELGIVPADATGFKFLEVAFQVFYWTGLVLLMVWSWRATKYLEDASAHDLTNGPAMAGFGYIIPIMCLWKPFETVRDIYKASRNPDGWPGDKRASIIGWWWAVYLIGNFAGYTVRAIPDEAYAQGLTEGQYIHLALVRLLILIGFVIQLIIVGRVVKWLKHKPSSSAAVEVF
jgi:hypothetical protein